MNLGSMHRKYNIFWNYGVAYKIGIMYDTPLSDKIIDRKVVDYNADLCDLKFSDILYC